MTYNVDSHGTSIEFTDRFESAVDAYRNCSNDCKIIAVNGSGAGQIIASKRASNPLSVISARNAPLK